MAKLSLIERYQSQLEETPIISGQLIIATDTGLIYRDIGNVRIPLCENIIHTDALPLAPINDRVYLLKPDKLYYYSSENGWSCLNENSSDNVIQELRKEIQDLKDQISSYNLLGWKI